MIKNDRQYRLTRASAERFRASIHAAASEAPPATIDPLIVQAHLDALKGQLNELEQQLREYEALASGKIKSVRVDRLDDLPRALIQARIAAGMDQKQLAERLGLKEQQIQRYEATDYQQASFARLLEIAAALNIRLSEDIVLLPTVQNPDEFLTGLQNIGVPKAFALDRLVPSRLRDAWRTDRNAGESLMRVAAKNIHRVFGWSPSLVLSGNQPAFDRVAAATARFKLSANADERFLSVYTLYAHYLALLLLQATEGLPIRRVPVEPEAARKLIEQSYGEFSFRSTLHFIWDLGIPVLPLNDSGAFHGACWRTKGRNVIVVKQRSQSAARWLFDVLHELDHAAQDPNAESREVLEWSETDPRRRESDEEQNASWFAGEVILGGRAEALTKQSLQAANKDLARLKSAVVRIAQQEAVDVGALANYVAFRLSLQGENWWGTAANLQTVGENPFEIARDVLLGRIDLARLTPIDRDLFIQALQHPEA